MTEKTKKLVVVGDEGVGKTCMLISYSINGFPNDYVPTVFDNYIKHCEIDGKNVSVALWDTSGQQDYETLRPLSYVEADVILLLFSVVSHESFENATTKWKQEIDQYCPGVPIILVGTKSDLRNDEKVLKQMKEEGLDLISKEMVDKKLKEIGAEKYIEISSLNGQNLNFVFEEAVRIVLKSSEEGSDKGCCVC